jgi:hypothetical protein
MRCCATWSTRASAGADACRRFAWVEHSLTASRAFECRERDDSWLEGLDRTDAAHRPVPDTWSGWGIWLQAKVKMTLAARPLASASEHRLCPNALGERSMKVKRHYGLVLVYAIIVGATVNRPCLAEGDSVKFVNPPKVEISVSKLIELNVIIQRAGPPVRHPSRRLRAIPRHNLLGQIDEGAQARSHVAASWIIEAISGIRGRPLV